MKNEGKAVPDFPRVHREPFQTANAVKARASCFIPRFSSRLSHIVLTSDAGAFTEGAAR